MASDQSHCYDVIVLQCGKNLLMDSQEKIGWQSGLGFGVCCDGVSTLQNYDITAMSPVTCSVEPGPTLIMMIRERHQNGHIRDIDYYAALVI